MMSGRSSRYPFTASQWQELEHQALIFKYMASGAPVPHDLLLPLRGSFFLDSAPPPAQLFPHQSGVGWGCFQMGLGRKVEDPEPGRCRRTDGKKWRCSKEAYPDSKYCERHMHRGKNRSRKPVEISVPPISPAAAAAPELLVLSVPDLFRGGGLPHPHGLSSCSLFLLILLLQRFFLALSVLPWSGEGGRRSSSVRIPVGDPRGGEGRPWRFTPLGMSSLGDPRQRSCSSLGGGGFFAGPDLPKEEEKRQRCFLLGADLKVERGQGGGEGVEQQRPLRRFFDDWPPPKEKDQQHGWGGGFPMTQLSISIPMAQRLPYD
ncbi:unnamed protein product [Spirodela intermedia]|uniref:Growth-regulating factor n=1 Tax=Spirodela intermedia TaxID=51605 RepID=A0A7I8J383_SPIIN|nr:unnamed protein product [Spirodela intermedia]CAA6664666.1 unnamed protein product [Spirodela intermedia]